MRIIAVTRNCLENERELILSSVEKDDKVLFFDSETEMIKSGELRNIEIVFGEPEYGTIRSMEKLRWIQMTWAGANKYTSLPDLPNEITVTSASGAYGYVISEYIVSGLLALTKKLFLYREQMKSGGWSKIEGNDTLEGKKAVILGTGNIGQETSKKLKCFGCYTVGICRTQGKSDTSFDEIYTIDDLENQLRTADVVVIALPGTKETAGMFDAEKFELMKNGAVLVNVGRGVIVNTHDLTNALQNGTLGGAVLDVTDPEPLPADHMLRRMENVVLTPHVSGTTWGENKHTRRRIIDIFCENLRRDSKNETKRNVIDFNRGY